MTGPRERRAFVRAYTAVATPPLVPEVRLHLATEITPLWEATETFLEENGIDPPFWAFPWVGGQALARYVLDHPETVRERRVVDAGSGSGLVAIAAAMAGAASVIAIDIDPLAQAAAETNADLNGVRIDVRVGDASELVVRAGETALSGDVCYARDEASALARWFGRCAADGALVLVGDPGRQFLPKAGLVERARYDIETSRELEAVTVAGAAVYEMIGPATSLLEPATRSGA